MKWAVVLLAGIVTESQSILIQMGSGSNLKTLWNSSNRQTTNKVRHAVKSFISGVSTLKVIVTVRSAERYCFSTAYICQTLGEMFSRPYKDAARMSRLQIICEMLPTMEDGVLLATFHHVVQECVKRSDISVSYLSKYPFLAAENQGAGEHISQQPYAVKGEASTLPEATSA